MTNFAESGYIERMFNMIINISNLCDIDKIHLHDASFNNMFFDYDSKKIVVKLEGEWNDGDFIIKFYDVLYHEMICCDFWGGGCYVVEWSLLDTTEIFDKLLRLERVEKAKSYSSNSENHSYMKLHEYFGVEILINSGDRFKIICKSVEICNCK